MHYLSLGKTNYLKTSQKHLNDADIGITIILYMCLHIISAVRKSYSYVLLYQPYSFFILFSYFQDLY